MICKGYPDGTIWKGGGRGERIRHWFNDQMLREQAQYQQLEVLKWLNLDVERRNEGIVQGDVLVFRYEQMLLAAVISVKVGKDLIITIPNGESTPIYMCSDWSRKTQKGTVWRFPFVLGKYGDTPRTT